MDKREILANLNSGNDLQIKDARKKIKEYNQLFVVWETKGETVTDEIRKNHGNILRVIYNENSPIKNREYENE